MNVNVDLVVVKFGGVMSEVDVCVDYLEMV